MDVSYCTKLRSRGISVACEDVEKIPTKVNPDPNPTKVSNLPLPLPYP